MYSEIGLSTRNPPSDPNRNEVVSTRELCTLVTRVRGGIMYTYRAFYIASMTARLMALILMGSILNPMRVDALDASLQNNTSCYCRNGDGHASYCSHTVFPPIRSKSLKPEPSPSQRGHEQPRLFPVGTFPVLRERERRRRRI